MNLEELKKLREILDEEIQGLERKVGDNKTPIQDLM